MTVEELIRELELLENDALGECQVLAYDGEEKTGIVIWHQGAEIAFLETDHLIDTEAVYRYYHRSWRTPWFWVRSRFRRL